MKNINFKTIFPHALVFAMAVFILRYEYAQAWVCMGIGVVLWLIIMGSDIKNGNH